jgi:NAD(P)-dependent dehydrogenase (short-subunit alcohol dehydrogenase family)
VTAAQSSLPSLIPGRGKASAIWLVTGATRGFGREIARAALDNGDRVVATARHPEQLKDFLEAHGDRVRTAALDVTDPGAARDAVNVAVAEFGRLDVVVNNAGYANSAPIEEMAEDDFRAQIEANLFGVVNVTRAALPVLRQQRSGVFVQFSSVGGRVGGTPGMGAYQTAKFAVEGFSEVLGNEVGPFRGEGDHYRAGRVSDRLVGLIDAAAPRRPRLRTDRRRVQPISATRQRQRAGRPGAGSSNHRGRRSDG